MISISTPCFLRARLLSRLKWQIVRRLPFTTRPDVSRLDQRTSFVELGGSSQSILRPSRYSASRLEDIEGLLVVVDLGGRWRVHLVIGRRLFGGNGKSPRQLRLGAGL